MRSCNSTGSVAATGTATQVSPLGIRGSIKAIPNSASTTCAPVGTGSRSQIVVSATSANIRPVIQVRVIQNLQHRMNRACLGIVRAVDQAGNPGMNEGPSAHCARFNCSKQLAIT